MKIDEPIHLSTWKADWIEKYEEEANRLSLIFMERAAKIEHIGSTSVEGMIAKPIIDIMIGLRLLEVDEDLEKQLNDCGYVGFGEAGVPGRLYYRKRDNTHINLQITEWGSTIWRDNLLFRDYLRSHPEEANEYSKTKQIAISKGYNTLLKYSDEKSEVIQRIMNNARKWNQ